MRATHSARPSRRRRLRATSFFFLSLVALQVSSADTKVELSDGSFSAWGAGFHFIVVIPALNVVVIHRVNTDDPAKKVTLEQVGQFLRLILAAKKP